jgi:hypothetical protein
MLATSLRFSRVACVVGVVILVGSVEVGIEIDPV